MNPVLKAVLERRSTRKYEDRPVEREKLEILAEAAVNGPSARNLQPWHYTFITDRGLLGEIEEGTRKAMGSADMRVLHGAPAAIVVSGHRENHWNEIDCGLSTENVLLAAHSLGLGTCVVGFVMRYFNTPESKGTLEKLCLPEGFFPLYAISVGYPAKTPDARPRDPSKVSWIE